MAESGDFELFNAPAAKESSEQSDEQFREQMRQAQAALKQLKKEEGKAQAQDDKVSTIILQFLSNPKNTDLFLLISRCVGHDIPSELILAVLALVDESAYLETEKFLEGEKKEPGAKGALIVSDQTHLNRLSPQQRQWIDLWVSHIVQVASRRPHRCLEALVKERWVKDEAGQKKKLREVSPPFVQLSAFIMRRFFAAQALIMEFEELHGFMQVTYVRLVSHLEELVKGQKKLAK